MIIIFSTQIIYLLNFFKDKIKFINQRKHSLNYIEFIRGYDKNNLKTINNEKNRND